MFKCKVCLLDYQFVNIKEDNRNTNRFAASALTSETEQNK